MTTRTTSILAVAIALLLPACATSAEQPATSAEQPATSAEQPATSAEQPATTVENAAPAWTNELTPSDFSSPARISLLEGRVLEQVEEELTAQGWTDIRSFTEEAYASQDFDGDFRPARAILVHNDGTVVQALIG